MLYIVSTPIGNLEDMTFRAVRVLKEVDIIASESIQRTSILLKRYGIKKNLISYNDHNKIERTGFLLKELKDNKDVALVSDAGTPGISDPGFYLVREIIREGIKVSPIPGPSALISGLVISGFPTDKFAYEGFLPRRSARRKKRLKEIRDEQRTLVFFEAPHRLISFLNDALEVLGDRQISVTRELTKKFEEVKRGTISDILDFYTKQEPRGEFVVVMEGATSTRCSKN